MGPPPLCPPRRTPPPTTGKAISSPWATKPPPAPPSSANSEREGPLACSGPPIIAPPGQPSDRAGQPAPRGGGRGPLAMLKTRSASRLRFRTTSSEGPRPRPTTTPPTGHPSRTDRVPIEGETETPGAGASPALSRRGRRFSAHVPSRQPDRMSGARSCALPGSPAMDGRGGWGGSRGASPPGSTWTALFCVHEAAPAQDAPAPASARLDGGRLFPTGGAPRRLVGGPEFAEGAGPLRPRALGRPRSRGSQGGQGAGASRPLGRGAGRRSHRPVLGR